jgi:hypothetical protein
MFRNHAAERTDLSASLRGPRERPTAPPWEKWAGAAGWMRVGAAIGRLSRASRTIAARSPHPSLSATPPGVRPWAGSSPRGRRGSR